MGRIRLRALFFLGALVALSRNAGEMTHQLEQAIGAICLLVFCLSVVGEKRAGEGRRLPALFGFVVIVLGFAALSLRFPFAVAAAALLATGLWVLSEGRGIEARDLPVYPFVAVCFALAIILGKTVPAVWYATRWIGRAVSVVGSTLSGTTVDFRSSFAGIPTAGLLVIFWIAWWLYERERRWTALLWRVVLTLAIQVLYLCVAGRLLGVLLPMVDATAGKSVADLKWHQALLARSVPWNFPLLLYFMYVPLLWWGVAAAAKPGGKGALGRGFGITKAIGLCSLVASLALLCFWPLDAGRQVSGKVVFYEKGFLNWEVPQFGRYGPLSAGMFGNLPRFVESLGLESRREAELTSETLKDAAALVIINLNHELPPGTTTTIWRFVERGGALMLLGDHTAYDPSGRVFANELLGPTAIRLNFDSANCPVGGWLHCYDFQWHRLTAGLGDERNEPGIVVGASLRIRPPAYPIILGRWGYEDRGNRFAPDSAYLGNMKFDVDEPLGGPVLAAAQPFGKGKVLVFGDTSSFVNGIVVGTHEFVGRVFRWLVGPKGHAIGPTAAVVAVILLVLSAVLLLLKGPPRQSHALLLGAIVLAVPYGGRLYWVRGQREVLRGAIAYIDYAHMPMVSQESARENGLMGLQMNLMRNGLLAFNLYDFDAARVAEADLLAIVAPARRFSERDIAIVRDYLERGGTVLISVGWEESAAARPLLSAFDMEVENVPLGFFRTRSPVVGAEAMFWEAWPVRDHSGKARVIAGHGEMPVMVIREVGKGRLVAIGDSSFLLNKNLEGEKRYNERNIAFLRALLQHLGVAREAER